jgi:ubiquinone/menaquinone biosynthesis C-methylase UbiE
MPLLSQGNVVHLPFASERFDLVYNLDVLDVFTPSGGGALEAMKEFYRVLRPGGLALVRVAAYRWLLSSHD